MNPATQRKPAPFVTDNEALALALQTAGVPAIECRNIYTKETLARLGFATARAAFEKGAKGTVTFTFERTPDLAEILAGWEEAETAHKARSDAKADACTPREFGRLAGTLHLKRREFGQVWRKRSPLFIEQEGEAIRTEEGDGYRITLPGMKICSIDAPEAVKRRLGFIK